LIDHGIFHKKLGFFYAHGFVEIIDQSISTPRATQHKSFGPFMKFHTLVSIFTKMGIIVVDMSGHAFVLAKICQYDINQCIGLPHNVSKGWIHFVIHRMPID
jgi:hypothetical protein